MARQYTTLQIVKGAGTELHYQKAEDDEYYTPETLDRNSLRFAEGSHPDEATYVERQPNGFELLYGGTCEERSSSSSSPSSSDSSISATSQSQYPSTSSTSDSTSDEETSSHGYSYTYTSYSHSLSSESSELPESSPSSSSSPSSASSSSCDEPPELGYVRSLLSADYAVPYLGVPIDCPAAEGQGGQPWLCAIDLEGWGEPWQPTTSRSVGSASYSIDGKPNILDRAAAAARLVRGFTLGPLGCGPGDAPLTAAAQVNLSNGNLVIAVRTPAAGPADPPVVFYYNSISRENRGYGIGWSMLYDQRIEQLSGSSIESDDVSSSSAETVQPLTAMRNAAGACWGLVWNDLGLLTEIVDPFDQRTTFHYSGSFHGLSSVEDSFGRITQVSGQRFTSPDLTSVNWGYDGESRLQTWVNPLGDVTTFAYDHCRRIKSITTPELRTTTFQYLEDDGIQRVIIEPGGLRTTLTLSEDYDVTDVVTPEGIELQYQWGPLQRLLAVRDGRGNETSFVYTGDDATHVQRLTTVQRPSGAMSFSYATDGNLETITDENAQVSGLTWEEGERRTLVNADVQTTTYAYNGRGQLTRLTNPEHEETEWEYDVRGRREAIVNPQEDAVVFDYDDENGQVNSITNGEEEETRIERDEAGRILHTTGPAPLNLRTEYEYDDNGRPTTVIVAPGGLNLTTATTYYADGRVQDRTDPSGRATTYVYDPVGNLKSVRNPRGYLTTYTYDGNNRLQTEQRPLGQLTTYGYDGSNNRTSRENALGETWLSEYDASNRLITETDPEGLQTTYSYDGVGNRTAVTQPATGTTPTLTTTTAYDALNRVESITDPSSRVTVFTYDAADRRTSTTNPAGETTYESYYPDGQLLTTTAPIGRVTTYEYDQANRLTATTDPLGETTVNGYDVAGRLRTVTDPESHTTTYTYDAASRRTGVTNPAGETTETSYTAAGQIESVTDPLGRTTSYEYDPNDNVLSVANPLSETTVSEYDAVDRLVAVTDPENHTTTYAYDLANRRTGMTTPAGRTTSYGYYRNGFKFVDVAPLNRRTTYTYDGAGRLWQVRTPDGLDTTTLYYNNGLPSMRIAPPTDYAQITTYVYDGADRMTSVQTPDGEITATTYEYGAGGLVKTVLDPLARLTTYVYDKVDRLAVTRAPGATGATVITTQTYWPDGQLLTVQQPLGKTTTYDYDLANRPATTVAPDGLETTQTYYLDGRLETQVAPLGRTTSYGYDAAGRTTEVTNPAGETTVSAYSSDGQLETSTNPLGKVTQYFYDADHLPTKTIDANGCIVTTVYDGAGRAIERIEPGPARATTVYDVMDRPWVRIDPLTRRTTYVYDSSGKVLSVADPGGTMTYGYDAMGNQVRRIDLRGVVCTSIYDAGNRLREEQYSGGPTFGYDYDAADNRTAVTGPDGGFTTSYDLLNRPTGVTDVDTGKTLAYAYDLVDRRLTQTDPDDGVTTYAYDGAGRLQIVENPQTQVTTFAYDAADRIIRKELADDVATSFTFNAAGQLTAQTTQGSSGLISGITYHLDDVGNRIGQVEADGSRTSFTLDCRSQLIAAVGTGSSGWLTFTLEDWEQFTLEDWEQFTLEGDSGFAYSYAYTYDAAARRQTFHDGTNLTTYTYDAADRLDYETTGADVTTYTYDAAGNRTQKETPLATTDYAFDAVGRLVNVDGPGGNVTLTYDPLGRRVVKEADGETVRSYYDFQKLLQERDDEDGLLRQYTTGLDPYGPLISDFGGGDSRWYDGDALGSTRRLLDADGDVVAQLRYDPYGKPLESELDTPLAFVGGQNYRWDPELELYLCGARYYDPHVGEFTAPDPSRKDQGEMTAYHYAANNPANKVDPSGLDEDEQWQRDYSEARQRAYLTAWRAAQAAEQSIDPAHWRSFEDFGRDEANRLRDERAKNARIAAKASPQRLLEIADSPQQEQQFNEWFDRVLEEASRRNRELMERAYHVGLLNEHLKREEEEWWARTIVEVSGMRAITSGTDAEAAAEVLLMVLGAKLAQGAGRAGGLVAKYGDELFDATRQAAKLRNAPTTPAVQRSFWNDPIQANGRRVYQRTDLFDPQAVDANGLTNLQRMQKGRAPVGYDGESVNLHHLTQLEPGPIAEVGGRFHSQNTKTLHGVVEDGQSFRYSPDGKTTEAEKAFRRWSYSYWQDRARGF